MSRRTPRAIDVTAFTTLYVVLLLAIPATYVLGPLGAVGTPAALCGLAGAGWWLVSRIVPGSGINMGRQPARMALLLFVCVNLVSYGLANRRILPLDQANNADRSVIFLVASVGIALLVADGVRSIQRLVVLLHRIVTGTAVVAVVGISQYLTKFDIVSTFYDLVPVLKANEHVNFAGESDPFSSIRRIYGTSIYPIEFGVVLALVLPFAACLALNDTENSGFRRWWKVTAIAATLPMTQSRSAIGVLMISGVILLVGFPKPVRRAVLQMLPVFVIGMRLVFPGLIGTITSLFVNFQSDPSFTSRTADYKVVPRYISQHPWFGRGVGTFLPKDFFFIDNQFIMSTIETGYIGTAFLVVVLLTGISVAARAKRLVTNEDERLVALAFLAALAGAPVGFATFDLFSFPMVTATYLLLLGCAGAYLRLLQEQRRAATTEPEPAIAVLEMAPAG